MYNKSPLIINQRYVTDELLSPTNDLELNIDDPDGLLETPTIGTDPKELFPENIQGRKGKWMIM